MPWDITEEWMCSSDGRPIRGPLGYNVHIPSGRVYDDEEFVYTINVPDLEMAKLLSVCHEMKQALEMILEPDEHATNADCRAAGEDLSEPCPKAEEKQVLAKKCLAYLKAGMEFEKP